MNIFSFFAGAGFLDLGFELQGNYNIVFVNEFYETFNRVYRYARQNMGLQGPRFGHHIEDITEYVDGKHEDRLQKLIEWVEESREEELTGFIGGPPCPDFSVAGKNKGRDGENGKLSGTYAQLICIAQPDFFLFENVKGLYRTARHRQFFEELKQQFRVHGYSLTEQLVNSLEYGAPQDRDRIILIGFHQRAIDILHLQAKNGTLIDFPWERHKIYNLEEVKKLPWPDIRTKDEGDVEKKCYKRLHRWRYSPTAAYGNNEVHIHPYFPRRISVAEALAIQSLPANFVLPLDISLTDAFKTVGNGVPFVLANGIAESISDYINHHLEE